MKSITVLSTACGAMFMPGFFDCLKENGEREIRIVGVDSAKLDYMSNFVDQFYQVPSIYSDDYIPAILDICRRENVDIVFPHISMELEKFAQSKEAFDAEGIRLALTNTATLHIANDKLALYDEMKRIGLNVPKYCGIKSADDFDKALDMLGYPERDVCIKIPDGSGQRGVRIVSAGFSSTDIFLHQKPSSLYITAYEMRKIVEEIAGSHNLMAMECLSMPEYTVDLLADNGEVAYVGGRMNVDSQMSIAQVSEVCLIPEAIDISRKIVKALRLNGNIGFDFMFDGHGMPVLTDLNPRVTATIILFKEAGINFPYLRVKQLLGEELPDCTLQPGLKLIRKYRDLIVR